MLSLRNRRGAVAIFTVLLFLALTVILAVVVDLSRLFYVRNELQTAADAAAMAGAIELLQDATQSEDMATTYGERNPALNAAAEVPEGNVVLGRWVDGTFVHEGVTALDADAVQVTAVRTPPHFLVARILGLTPGTLRATAIAWARQPIATTASECMKPWALPYVHLTDALNRARGVNLPLDRALTKEDTDKLAELTASGANQTELAFTLHQGPGNTTGLPGNYYDVVLPSYWMASTQDYRRNDDGTLYQHQYGLPPYLANISGCNTQSMGPGDSLRTEPGQNNPEQRKQAVEGLCGGPCSEYDGGKGFPMVSSFWLGNPGGRDAVEVQMLASFRLTNVTGPGGGANACSGCISGYFEELKAAGTPAAGNTTIVKPILVK